ncbi:MAG: ATP-binding protein, partial [Desertifilum sp. SIO1I2]|nr:ATP-binding protein [Desertifilum sp. SIO1I2]
SSIHNPDYFFGILYNLINSDPELQELACQWLRGDDLSDESLKLLGIKNAISTETDACETLFNFSRIATETFPIVLCFDQVQSCARLPDGKIDLPTLMGSISKIHDETYNFLVLLSVSSNSWKENQYTIDVCHIDRIDSYVNLKPIKTPQIEALLAARLGFLHHQAKPKPSSPIYPITADMLEDEFPRGRTTTREALAFGRDVIQSYKKWLFGGKQGEFKVEERVKPEFDTTLAKFKNEWNEKLKKSQATVKRIQRFSSPELIQMLKEALGCLGITEIQTPFLTKTTFSSYSLSYCHPQTRQKVGILWTEDQNMRNFYYAMEACRKAIESQSCDVFYLLREQEVERKATKGYKTYSQLFNGKPHRHIQTRLPEIQYLHTYYEFTKEAREGDFTLGGWLYSVKDLKSFVKEAEILNQCLLFFDLKVIEKTIDVLPKDKLKSCVYNCVVDQQWMSQNTLIQQVLGKLKDPSVDAGKIEQAIEELSTENKISITGNSALEKFVAWVPGKH